MVLGEIELCNATQENTEQMKNLLHLIREFIREGYFDGILIIFNSDLENLKLFIIQTKYNEYNVIRLPYINFNPISEYIEKK